MATFLVRDFDDPRGYKEYKESGDNPPTSGLPRIPKGYVSAGTFQNGESFVPWGITENNQVVYARVGENAGFRGGSGPHLLRPYDALVSQQRRALAESQLGMIALTWPHFTRDVVRKVSAGVKSYLTRHYFENNSETMDAIFKNMGHYMHTGGSSGFGRLTQDSKDTLGRDGVWKSLLQTLETGKLEQQMAIHDGVGRKILPILGDPPKSPGIVAKYNAWGPKVREAWFDIPAQRGRIDTPDQKAKQVKPTNAPGIAPVGTRTHSILPAVTQSRTRGVDMYQRDLEREHHPNADDYFDDADSRNMLFGAGISGTTGSLLQAANAFGGITGGEPLKQYVLAIIGYLVGGGMHSFHESMSIAKRVGVPYNPGAFLPSLPISLVYSPQYGQWRDAYYDVVVLGAVHWRYNAGVIPSHLNRTLKLSQ